MTNDSYIWNCERTKPDLPVYTWHKGLNLTMFKNNYRGLHVKRQENGAVKLQNVTAE